MSCSNCYNGCQEITSDKCVKYTGVNSVPLGIKNGDNVNYVLQELISRVVSYLNGSGIDISINIDAYCELVTKYLPACKPTCEPPTLPELLEALVKAACDLQGQIDTTNTALDAVESAISTLNANYTLPSTTPPCLTGVTASSDTHDIVQAIIDKLCALNVDVSTNYVKIADLNTYIAAYLASIGTSTKYYNKMVPYTAVEFFPTPAIMANFTVSGAGLGDWEKIYLCNGQNNTPDMRGRSPICAIAGMGSTPLDSQVNPAVSPLNINYALGTKNGVNGVVLTESNLPSHTHTINAAGDHTHVVIARAFSDASSGVLVGGGDDGVNDGSATTSSSGNHTHTANPTGGNAAHANTHPVIACYYIMYIP